MNASFLFIIKERAGQVNEEKPCHTGKYMIYLYMLILPVYRQLTGYEKLEELMMTHCSAKGARRLSAALVLMLSLTVLFAGSALADVLALPSGLKTIEAEAFYGDKKLNEVVLPAGIERIESKAFASSSLKKINLPSGLSYIAEDAFDGCGQVDAAVTPETYAAHYAARKRWVAPSGADTQWDFYKNTTGGDLFTNRQIMEYNIKDGDLKIVTDVIMTRYLLQGNINSDFFHVDFFAYALNEVPNFDDITQIHRRQGDFLWNQSMDGIIAIRTIEQEIANGSLATITTAQMLQAPYLMVHFGVTEDSDTDWYSFGIHFYEESSPLDWFTFSDNGNGTCTLTGYTGPEDYDGDIVIPRRNGNGLTVTSIGNNAFASTRFLTASVSIPNSVTSIGSRAFLQSAITGIMLPSSLRTIGSKAFWNCNGISELRIPEGVTSIEQEAFLYCYGLEIVYMPQSLQSIGTDAFGGNDNFSIFGVSGSYAESWAQSRGLFFRDLSETDFSESAVRANMLALQGEYYEGRPWTNNDTYTIGYYTGQGCVAFCYILSDATFYGLPLRELHSFTYDDVRVGDILRINGDTHSVIVLEKYADHVVIAEGNYNSSIHWGRTLTRAQVEAADYLTTRYPD